MWIEGNERSDTYDKNVILHGNNNQTECIRLYYGCYDPLSYPLFFPKAELGWHLKIPKVDTQEEHMSRADADDNSNDDDPGNISYIIVYKTFLYGTLLHTQLTFYLATFAQIQEMACG